MEEKDKSSSDDKKRCYHVLILGASYGSLFSIKLLLAGHNVTLVCRAATAELFNESGSIVRMPMKGSPEKLVELRSKHCPGTLRAVTPDDVTTPLQGTFDLVVLAMQEPQYSSTNDVRSLVQRIAASSVPVLALTNMPLPPYLARIPALNKDQAHISNNPGFRACYHDAALWDSFVDHGRFTQCSPDPQAFRPADQPNNILQVKLPTNFKAARFQDDEATNILRQLEHDIQQATYKGNLPGLGTPNTVTNLPVKLRVHDSLFVPLAKWAMLLTGNYRCITPYPQLPMLSIQEAVCAKNVDESKTVYQWVLEDLCCDSLGAPKEAMVPFDKYFQAAASLQKPSSAARALQDGATKIERVDQVVKWIAAQQGIQQCKVVDQIVARVDQWLEENNKQLQPKEWNEQIHK